MDPASYDTGWALFEGNDLVQSGYVQVSRKEKDVFVRLRDMYLAYFELGDQLGPLDECHIEEFKPFATKPGMKLVGSVYVIGAALACYAPIGRIWTTHWQKFSGYKKGEEPIGRLRPFADSVQSEDELAAIGMGIWYLSKNHESEADDEKT